MDKEYKLGSIVTMKKEHPCGTNEWEIVRLGADIKINYFAIQNDFAEIPQQDFDLFHFSRVPRARRNRTKPGDGAECTQHNTSFQKIPAVHASPFPVRGFCL